MKTNWLYSTDTDAKTSFTLLIERKSDDVDDMYLPHRWQNVVGDLDIRRDRLRELLNELPAGIIGPPIEPLETESHSDESQSDESDYGDDTRAIDGLLMLTESSGSDDERCGAGSHVEVIARGRYEMTNAVEVMTNGVVNNTYDYKYDNKIYKLE